MNTQEHSAYIDIFYPNGMSLDNNANVDEYGKFINLSMEKAKFIDNLLGKYSLLDIEFTKKMKKCIPYGLNKFHTITDQEYENLKKEFKDIK